MAKKFIFTLVLIAATSIVLNAAQVSETRARALAEQFFNTSLPVQAPAMKAKARGKVATPFYVYNNPQQPGWVIIAGDDRARTVLAWGDEYYFDENDVPECVQDWLSDYAEQISSIDSDGTAESADSFMSSFAASNKARIAPMLMNNWGQRLPYNQMCPTLNGKLCVTGCVATAMAQILYYYKSSAPVPAIPAFTSTTNKIDVPELPATTFNYSIMNDWYDNEESESASAMEVAKLMRYCGQAVKMNYDTIVSYSQGQVVAFTKYFGYDKDATYEARCDHNAADWENMIYTELSYGRPVYMTAQKMSSGHAFICDGYDKGLYHINWGWYGHQNGYFALNALSDGSSGGTGAASGTEGYTLRVMAMLGLQPSTGSTSNTNGNVITLYKPCTTPTTTFTRTDNTQDFTGVNPFAYYYNLTSIEQTFDLGWDLYDNNDNCIATFTVKEGQVMKAGWYYYPNSSLSFGKNLPDGTYNLFPVCRVTGTKDYHPCNKANVNYVEAKIAGNTMTLEVVDAASLQNLKINSHTTSAIKKEGSPMTITLNVTNEGSIDYSTLFMRVDNKAVSATATDIAPGKTGEVVFGYIPTAAGTKTFEFSSDKDGNDILYSTEITFESSTEASITGTNEASLSGTTFNTSVTVTNTNSNAYNDYIVARLYKKEPHSGTIGYMCDTRTQIVSLASGVSTTLNFSFENLEFPETYFVIYFYYNNGRMVRIGATASLTTVSPYDKLDVNQDGAITGSDVTGVYNVILGNSNRFLPWADANGDGKVTASDVTAIYNNILNLK